MEIRNLITFMQVAEQCSFTRAAAALGYSQSTVSFQIKALEGELGCLLLERVGRTVRLTEKGHSLLEYARQVCYLTDEFNGTLHGPDEVRGHLRILAPDSVCEDMMMQNYADFHRRYPHISLKFISAGTDDMFRLLDRNEADLMLTLDGRVYRHNYVIAREEEVGMHFVTGTSSPYANARPLSLPELAALPFVLTERGLGYRRLLDEEMAKHSLELLPILELGRTDVIVTALAEGAGVSYLPDFVTRRAVEAGRLTYLHVPEMQARVWKQLIYHKNKSLTAAMAALLAYIKENEFRR